LAEARQRRGTRAPALTDFFLGCAINPFKKLENELIP